MTLQTPLPSLTEQLHAITKTVTDRDLRAYLARRFQIDRHHISRDRVNGYAWSEGFSIGVVRGLAEMAAHVCRQRPAQLPLIEDTRS